MKSIPYNSGFTPVRYPPCRLVAFFLLAGCETHSQLQKVAKQREGGVGFSRESDITKPYLNLTMTQTLSTRVTHVPIFCLRALPPNHGTLYQRSVAIKRALLVRNSPHPLLMC